MYKAVLRTISDETWWILLACVCAIIWNSNSNDYYYYIAPDFHNDTAGYVTEYPVILWSKHSTEHYIQLAADYIAVCGKLKCTVARYSEEIQQNVNVAYIFDPHTWSPHIPLVPPHPAIAIRGLFLTESPTFCVECMDERTIRSFNFSSTYSRYSDVPFPLQWIQSLDNITSKKYYIDIVKKNTFLKEISPILYLQSHCLTSTERDLYVQELIKYQTIDSFGACLNNKEIPLNLRRDSFYMSKLYSEDILKFIARYKFVIAIENSVCNDYVTEKFWRAIHVGVVPIYFGSPSIRDWFPNKKSAILLEDFPSPKLLSTHIDKLMRNDDMYEEYLEHKTKGIITNKYLRNEIKARPYQTDITLIIEKFTCFLCEKLHGMNDGPAPHRVINESHFNCPLPRSALTQRVNPVNPWVSYTRSIIRNLTRI
ncbi:alpha-(1,3)-fucosyltransferase 10-like [Hyposmocoma kahamanoa]|uniref:alpha-(1,3)-fucosyltransferase 10-like n=1 Tax=Hyposmocoma kahamanoa TaxID=1477025 RepID=UPI000E6D7B9D|nr:alpha-(1,3)-fucosyltransferase 10-like [Hyposmocoma kahamanoa]